MNTCADMGGSANAGLESASPVTKAMAMLPDANIRRLADYAIHYCMSWDEARSIYDALLFIAEDNPEIRREALRIKEHYLRLRDERKSKMVVMTGTGATYNEN